MLKPYVPFLAPFNFRYIQASLFFGIGRALEVKQGEVELFSRGIEAIRKGLECLELNRQGEVLVPYGLCQEVVLVLAGSGLKLRYYDVNEQLQPHWEGLHEQDLKNVTLFYHAHFSGFDEEEYEIALQACISNSWSLVEDRALCFPDLDSAKPPNSNVIVIYSLRKFLPIQSGGVLIRHSENHVAKVPSTACCFKEESRFLLKSMIYRLAIAGFIPLHKIRRERLDDSVEASVPDVGISGGSNSELSCFSYFWLTLLDVHAIKKRRASNVSYFIEQLRSRNLNVLAIKNGEGVYSVILRVSDAGLIVRRLYKIGIESEVFLNPAFVNLEAVVNPKTFFSIGASLNAYVSIPIHQFMNQKRLNMVLNVVGGA